MGNPSPTIHSGRPRATSTVFSVVTALLPFLAPPIASLVCVLDMLLNEAQEIMNISQKSKRRELVDFSEYAGKMVNQLVTALQNHQLEQQPEVRKNLEELQKILRMIVNQMSRTNSGGILSLIRRLMFPEEIDVARMRQQLDDGLHVFQFGAMVQLLSNSANPLASDTAKPPEFNYSQTPDTSQFSHDSVRNDPRPRGSQAPQVSERARHTRQRSSAPEHHNLTSITYSTGSRRPQGAVTSTPRPEPGEVTVAFMNVESCRRSFHHHRSVIKKMELAIALDRLSALLARAGRTREALQASQEAAEQYKALAEMEH